MASPVRILGAGPSGLAAAIVLARAGRDVEVHEARADSGARFAGDFQGIENWTSPIDAFDELRAWGIDPSAFASTELRAIDVVGPDGRRARVASDRVACRVVRRGTQPGSLDQGLKALALAHGVRLRYGARGDPADFDVVATGPKRATGIVRGELFRTDHPDRVALQLDPRLAPGAYTYLIVLGGVGLVATVLLRRRRDADALLDATIAGYEARFPGLRRRDAHRFSGVGGFGVGERYAEEGRLYVGEAAGLQDCFWGFGIRYALASGRLAAQALLGGEDYESAVRRELRPLQLASLANRAAMDALGATGLSLLLGAWRLHQRARGDGLRFLERLYRPSPVHRAVVRGWGERLLAPPAERDRGRGVRYLAFRDE